MYYSWIFRRPRRVSSIWRRINRETENHLTEFPRATRPNFSHRCRHSLSFHSFVHLPVPRILEEHERERGRESARPGGEDDLLENFLRMHETCWWSVARYLEGRLSTRHEGTEDTSYILNFADSNKLTSRLCAHNFTISDDTHRHINISPFV